jgi:hypothetical protein
MEIRRTKNVATVIVFPIQKNDGTLITGAAGLDSEIDHFADGTNPDGFADCTNEATEIGSTGQYYLALSQAESNYDYSVVQVKSSTAGALTQTVLINRTLQQADVAAISTDATAADNCELMFDGTGYAGGTAKLGVDVVAISGDATAADNEEKFFDGTGYAGTNNVMPTTTTVTNAVTATLANGAHGGAGTTITLQTPIVANTTLIEGGDATDAIAAASAGALEELADGTNTYGDFIRGTGAVLMGKTTGSGTATVVFRDIVDTKNSVTMTIASDRDRSAVTLDLTDDS